MDLTHKIRTSIFWFRRDLRLDDNHGLFKALENKNPVIPIFIFDKEILSKLEDKSDARISFIHNQLAVLKKKLNDIGSDILVFHTSPINAFKKLIEDYEIDSVYTNKDYEPYAKERDSNISHFLNNHHITLKTFKDQVIFEKEEISKDDGKPYTVFTPYAKKWKSRLSSEDLMPFDCSKHFNSFAKIQPTRLLSLSEIGFDATEIPFPNKAIDLNIISNYDIHRDFPSAQGTTKLSVHLRFGSISIRKCVSIALKTNETWLNELIWREFYMMILWNFPYVAKSSFKPKYDQVEWINNEVLFEKWCKGETGYPIVDAGMRELNTTGFMHNRVRMIVASFLTKHLLIDWRWGEAYFAKKLLDFELASNNGGWQWASGSGCDAAPYFRVFSPELQTKKFDPSLSYIKKWVPEFEDFTTYPRPIVEHSFARNRAIERYKKALSS